MENGLVDTGAESTRRGTRHAGQQEYFAVPLRQGEGGTGTAVARFAAHGNRRAGTRRGYLRIAVPAWDGGMPALVEIAPGPAREPFALGREADAAHGESTMLQRVFQLAAARVPQQDLAGYTLVAEPGASLGNDLAVARDSHGRVPRGEFALGI